MIVGRLAHSTRGLFPGGSGMRRGAGRRDRLFRGSGFAAAILLAIITQPMARAGSWSEPLSIDVDGVDRYFRIYTPEALQAPPPLMLWMHGGSGNYIDLGESGASVEWTEVADEQGFLLVFPNGFDPQTGTGDGLEQSWGDCRADLTIPRGGDDVAFIDALLDWAIAGYDVDPQRIYAGGGSNGGLMSFRLAFELGHRIAAIAPFIANLPAVSNCRQPVDPTPALFCMGDAEQFYMPWDGGCVASDTCSRGSVLSAEATRDHWLQFNQVDDEAPLRTDYDLDDNATTVSIWTYGGGLQGSEVAFCRLFNAGHNLPTIDHPYNQAALLANGLGLQSRDIESARVAWEFLSRQRLDGPTPTTTQPGRSVYLAVDKAPSAGRLLLRWSSDCGAGDRYGIYRGDLAAGYDSLAIEPARCAVESTRADIPAGPGAHDFFLVVPATATREGGYGLRSDGSPRPAALGACRPQTADIASCFPD